MASTCTAAHLLTHSPLQPVLSAIAVSSSNWRSSSNGECGASWRGAGKAGGVRCGGEAIQSWNPVVCDGSRRMPKLHFSGSQRRESLHALLSTCCQAKRKSVENRGGLSEGEYEELDEDMRGALNEISTEAVKVMLSENDKMVAAMREKVDSVGEYLAHEKEIDAARFMLVVKGMLDHELLTEADALQGAYKKAYDKIVSVVEDSGWVLKREGDDVGGVEMVDDELISPVLNSQY